MKKMMSTFLMTMLAAGLFLFPATEANAKSGGAATYTVFGNQDFTLVNKTGVEIYAVYVSPHNSDEWGEDILGRDTLPPGESVEITFSRSEKAKFWDIRVEDKDENYIEWENFNLLEISTIKLFYKNGRATAEYN